MLGLKGSLSLQSGHSTLPRPLCNSCIEQCHPRPSKKSFCCFIFSLRQDLLCPTLALTLYMLAFQVRATSPGYPRYSQKYGCRLPNYSHQLYGPGPTLDQCWFFRQGQVFRSSEVSSCLKGSPVITEAKGQDTLLSAVLHYQAAL